MIYDNPTDLVTGLIILIKHDKWSISPFPLNDDNHHRSALSSAYVLPPGGLTVNSEFSREIYFCE